MTVLTIGCFRNQFSDHTVVSFQAPPDCSIPVTGPCHFSFQDLTPKFTPIAATPFFPFRSARRHKGLSGQAGHEPLNDVNPAHQVDGESYYGCSCKTEKPPLLPLEQGNSTYEVRYGQ